MSGRQPITAVVLCGGRATRLGSLDKPLLKLAGRPLLAHVIERLEPQVDAIVLSCAQSLGIYARFGYPVVTDRHTNEGPLGGIVSALPGTATPWILTTPADTPFLPANFASSLVPACRRRGSAVVRAGGHRQNLAMLLDRRQARSLAAFYESGGRAAHRWLVENDVEEVELAAAGFFNVNTSDDLAQARDRLAKTAKTPLGARVRE